MPIQAAQTMLITQAVISRVNLTGYESKSARIQSRVERNQPPNDSITVFDPPFPELYSILRGLHLCHPVWISVQS